MKGPLDIHQHLLGHDVRHEIVRLPRGAARKSSLAEALELPAHRCLTTHPFHATVQGQSGQGQSGQGQSVLVIVLTLSDEDVDQAGLALRLSALLKQRLGRATFVPASSSLVSSHTDYLADHLAPLLLPPDVIVVATSPLVEMSTATVYMPAGDAGTALGIRALDLLVLTRAMVLPERRSAPRRRPVTIDLDAAPTAASPATRRPSTLAASTERAAS
jgi:hypothetical protein